MNNTPDFRLLDSDFFKHRSCLNIKFYAIIHVNHIFKDETMSPIKRFLLLLALTAMWSPSFLFIKLAVQDLPPLTIAATRIGLASIILYGIVRWKGYSFPKEKEFWFHASMMGLFSSCFPFCLFCYAEGTIDSSLAAVLNGTTPMFTALLAHLFVPSDRLSVAKTVGIALSLGGLIFLFAPYLMENGFNGNAYGMLAAAIASFCYSVGHVYAKKYYMGHKPFVGPTASLLTSALFLWPFAAYYEHPFSLPMPSPEAIFGVLGLALLGTVLAFILYFKLLEECGPTAVSLVACFFPVGGMLLGFIFLGETLTLGNLFAASMILMGMMVVNKVIRIKSWENPPTPISDIAKNTG